VSWNDLLCLYSTGTRNRGDLSDSCLLQRSFDLLLDFQQKLFGLEIFGREKEDEKIILSNPLYVRRLRSRRSGRCCNSQHLLILIFQTLSEVERAINDVTSSTLSFNEMKDWLVVCQSFNKGDFFGINTEKSLSDKNFVKVATIHNILIPKTIVLHHHQIILNHFISL